MSGPPSFVRQLGRLPQALRTVRHLRLPQALAQIRHAIYGITPPCTAPGPAPRLAISAPDTPYLPPPAHVRSHGAGRFELLATPFETPRGSGWASDRHGPLFAYHLQQHEYLRCEDVSPAERIAVLEDWIRSHRAGIGWDPHPTGLRLLAWGKLLTTPDLLPEGAAGRAELLGSFADQAETLSRNLEVRLQANHLLSNLLCVVFAGMLVETSASAAWRSRALLLRRELARQIRPDGGHEERSPMYHAALLETVLDLLNLCRAAPERAPEGLDAVLAESALRMLEALEILAHRDGRIALFADSAFGIAAEPAALRDYAARLIKDVRSRARAFRGSACLRDTGFVRLEASDWLLIASVGEPSPPHQPGHAHCDALAFELSIAGQRLVTDTGVFEYVIGERRQRARSTASHATLQIDGEEQAEIWAAHRVGGRPEVRLIAWSEDGQAEATCRGWSRPALIHRRRFRVTDSEVELEDSVAGPARAIRACLPIAPGWEVELLSDSRADSRADSGAGPRAICRSRESAGFVVEIELPSAFAWKLESGAYYPSFGRELTRPVLIGVGASCSAARTRFRRVG